MRIKEIISPQAWDKLLQDEGTNIMIGIRDINDTIIYYLLLIIILVGYIIIKYIYENINITTLGINIKNLSHSTSQNIEIIWTLFPAIILIIIAIPSLKLLYTMEEIIKPLITLKVKGNQWYWSYNINDYENLDINFDSYLLTDNTIGNFRLLEVDQHVCLPINTPIRLLITSEDVIHSFGIPSLGIKIDAIPGRLNLGYLNILRPGTYYGQCYELCGQAHALMPIKIIAVKEIDYYYWLFSNFSS